MTNPANPSDPGMDVTIVVKDGPTCPRCGGVEVLQGGPVRPFKIDMGQGWESNCTACSIWFIDDRITEENGVRV